MLTYDLSQRGDESLYEYLYLCIRADIESGVIPAGRRLPSKRSLAKHLGVSLITVEGAYAQLLAEGYAYSEERRGYFASAIDAGAAGVGARAGQRASDFGRVQGASGAAGSAGPQGFPPAAHPTASDAGLRSPSLRPVARAAVPRPAAPLIASFAAGSLPPSRFPFAAWSRSVREVLSREPEAALLGVGLAAPQVGVLRRVCVVLDEDDQLIELVNPEIVCTEGEQTGLEGCLSVPGKYGEVTRPYLVRVRAQDRDGHWFEAEDEGLTARCFCHEIEHLDGHLFVEHTDHLMEGEELQRWLEAHADEYEIEETEEEDT